MPDGQQQTFTDITPIQQQQTFSNVTPLDVSGLRGATISAPPSVFSGQWFKEKADRASDYLGTIGATIGAIAGSPAGPGGAIGGAALGGAAGESSRQLVQRALGTNYNVPQTSGQAAAQIGTEGAIQGGLEAATQGIGTAAKAIAPSLAESSLGVNAAMRSRGRTVGQAILDNTSGIGPKAVSESAADAVDNLTQQLESSVNAATSQGKMGSTLPAHQVLDNAIRNTPRNARTLIDKLNSLRDVLDLGNTNANAPMQTTYTPTELLEIKRGIGKEIDTWPPEWRQMSDVKRVTTQLYGAIDRQLDQLAPGTQQINQQISSLIPVINQGKKVADQAGLSQLIAHRLSAHTGALAGAGIGGAFGYQRGGPEGAVLGGTLGLVGPELIASPSAQMLGARTLFNAPRAAIPLAALGGGLADYLRQPNRNQNNDQ
jgi:hypothetical protein